MGKIPQGILGGVSGKVGGIVGTSWKGINVIKTKPLTVANPRTAGQIAQRSKFGNATKFASLILAGWIKPLWDRFASKQSGYNAFISDNVHLFDQPGPQNAVGFVASKGKMAATAINSVILSASTKIADVDWTLDAGEGFKLANDEVYIMAFKPGNELAEGNRTTAVRDDEAVQHHFNMEIVEGEDYVIVIAFRRSDGTIVSDSSSFLVTAVA